MMIHMLWAMNAVLCLLIGWFLGRESKVSSFDSEKWLEELEMVMNNNYKTQLEHMQFITEITKQLSEISVTLVRDGSSEHIQ